MKIAADDMFRSILQILMNSMFEHAISLEVSDYLVTSTGTATHEAFLSAQTFIQAAGSIS